MADEKPPPKKASGIPGIAIFFIVAIILILIGLSTWVIFTQMRARRLGLPAPPLSSYLPFKTSSAGARNYPNSSSSGPGPLGWVKDKLAALRNKRGRTAGPGAYEAPSRSGGALDPDEAWDSHVGTEADAYGPGGYYEEQELGLRPESGHPYRGYDGGAYGGASAPGAAMPAYGEGERGRSRTRGDESRIGGGQPGLDQRYDEEAMGRTRQDPFGDGAERSDMSLRGVSPRPMAATARADSPSGKRSLFREDV